ncbi:MAG TPA: MFS transporter [Pseudonocardia sp.]|nr:MFS transporter [Pseudonocardia sp.]
MSDRAGVWAALRVPNFRRYFAGQAVSLVGTWMQTVALSWLVLELTGSGAMLGLVAAAQFAPVLALGAYRGLLTDRMDKRRVLVGTNTALALIALLLGLLTVTHAVRLWMVFGVATALGVVSALDAPARQTFVPEIVGSDHVQNAVSLNSVLVNASRAVGSAVAGLLIATVGVGVCFLVNALSFIAVLVALTHLRVAELLGAGPEAHRPGQVRDGLRYVRRNPGLWVPLLMMALVGTLAYEFQVVLPLLTTVGLHAGARTFGLLTAAMGAGAVAGGLATAGLSRAGLVPFTAAAAVFATALLIAAVVPTLAAELAALSLVGAASTMFMATGNSTLQLTAHPRYRGRVMALWSVAFLGSTPVGAPIVGAVCDRFGPRAGLGVGAVACAVATGIGVAALGRPEARVSDSRMSEPRGPKGPEGQDFA